MSILFKNMWRNVLRGNTFNSPIIRPRNLSCSVVEITQTKSSQDQMMLQLKQAPQVTDVLAMVSNHLPVMTHKHMIQALLRLFQLHRRNKSEEEIQSLVKDPTFTNLCQNLKNQARALDLNDAIEATKVLTFLQVPPDSLILQTMLQLIRSNINDINLRQIMFMDFLLSKFEKKNHLVDALKLALPLAFQVHLPLEMDSEDLPLLKEMLSYCCVHKMPDRCVNNVVTALLLHDQAIDSHTAKSIIWCLCDMNCTEERFPTRVQLLHICCDILTQSLDTLSYEDVLRTAAKLKGRVCEKHQEYYHELLMDSIADYVVQNNVPFEKALLIARILSRMAHTNLALVQYLCTEAVSNPMTLVTARPNILFGFINSLSNNNYTPEDNLWLELRRQMSLNPFLTADNPAMPWTKICLELASLGHYEDQLIARVFSKEFLKKFLCRDNNTLDYLQLLTLHEAVQTFHSKELCLPEGVLSVARSIYPTHSMSAALEEYLARGLGGKEFVARNVALPSGIVTDLLLVLKNRVPIVLKRPSEEKAPLHKFEIPEGAIPVCVMGFNQGCFSMNSNRLRGTFRLLLDIMEAQGFAPVSVNITEWLAAPPHERTPYLMREVGYKCGEIGVKLSAT